MTREEASMLQRFERVLDAHEKVGRAAGGEAVRQVAEKRREIAFVPAEVLPIEHNVGEIVHGAEGEVREVELHDGSRLRIRKLDRDYDPTSRLAAITTLELAEQNNEVLTGVLYVNTAKPTLLESLNLADEPLATLPESKVRPPKTALDEAMQELR
jgi:2-oxoglutarate ferredoxin oxidoreductase subunit beta